MVAHARDQVKVVRETPTMRAPFPAETSSHWTVALVMASGPNPNSV
jgi:hypothetical protein